MNPISLIDENGRAAFGVYQGEMEALNLCDYKGLRRILKPIRAKKWRFVGLFHPEAVAGIAVVQSGYVATCFAYVFDMTRMELVEYTAVNAFGLGCRISDNARSGEAVFHKGGNRVALLWGLPEGRSRVEVRADTPMGPLDISADIDEDYALTTPHQIVTPTPGGSFAFTHKSAGMPASARIQAGKSSFEFSADEAFAGTDHTAGYHDYHWEWRWSALGGRSVEGARVGLNLVDPIHHDTYQENALWIDGVRIPMGRARFDYNPQAILSPWRIGTRDGTVDLSFQPLGKRAETINAGIILSRFAQPVGLYSGTITPPNGRPLTLKDVPGVAEDHLAKW